MTCSFVVDAMLGTLAKWLRILGHDTLFERLAVDRVHKDSQGGGIPVCLIHDQVVLFRDDGNEVQVKGKGGSPDGQGARCRCNNGFRGTEL